MASLNFKNKGNLQQNNIKFKTFKSVQEKLKSYQELTPEEQEKQILEVTLLYEERSYCRHFCQTIKSIFKKETYSQMSLHPSFSNFEALVNNFLIIATLMFGVQVSTAFVFSREDLLEYEQLHHTFVEDKNEAQKGHTSFVEYLFGLYDESMQYTFTFIMICFLTLFLMYFSNTSTNSFLYQRFFKQLWLLFIAMFVFFFIFLIRTATAIVDSLYMILPYYCDSEDYPNESKNFVYLDSNGDMRTEPNENGCVNLLRQNRLWVNNMSFTIFGVCGAFMLFFTVYNEFLWAHLVIEVQKINKFKNSQTIDNNRELYDYISKFNFKGENQQLNLFLRLVSQNIYDLQTLQDIISDDEIYAKLLDESELSYYDERQFKKGINQLKDMIFPKLCQQQQQQELSNENHEANHNTTILGENKPILSKQVLDPIQKEIDIKK